MKKLVALKVMVGDRVIRTIRAGESEEKARVAAQVQMQRWNASEQFVGHRLHVEEVRG